MAGSGSGIQSSIGDMDPLITQYIPNASSGSISSLSFNNIPQTYTHLQIRGTGYFTTANNPFIRFNSDSASNYSWHHAWSSGAGTAYNYASPASFMFVGYADSANQPVSFYIDILDYRNTNKFKTVRAQHAGEFNGGSGEVALWSGTWRNKNAAVTSIQFSPGGGNFAVGSQISLYGVK